LRKSRCALAASSTAASRQIGTSGRPSGPLQSCERKNCGSPRPVSVSRRKDRYWPGRDCRPSGLAAPKLPSANYGSRPSPAVGDFPGDWQVYLGSGRWLDSSGKAEFGESGHRRPSTRDTREIAADWRLSTRAKARYRPTADIAPDGERPLKPMEADVEARRTPKQTPTPVGPGWLEC